MKRLGKFLWGLVLVPFTLATLYHLPACALAFNRRLDAAFVLGGGVGLYALFELLFSRPMRTYVFGHELTHALASIVMGGKVHSFHVSEKGGSVSLSKSNFFVALAPYCVPLYTLFVLLVAFCFRKWYPFPHLQAATLAAVGFTLAFHGSLTFFAIRQRQPDIHKTGFFFSLVFILLVNAWILVLLSKLLFGDLFSLKAFFWNSLNTQLAIWKWLAVKIMAGALWAYHYLRSLSASPARA